jgi:hypothetical protein
MASCPHCSTSYDATNQHSTCPKCGKALGTDADQTLVDQHAKVKKWFDYWDTSTVDDRKLSMRDRDYYDGEQWTAEQIKHLSKRGQAPIVKNRIFKKINFLLGTEVRNRSDPKALPRTQQHDQDAEVITDVLRYVFDDQQFDGTASLAWEDKCVEGYSGAVVEHEIVGMGKDRSVEVRIRHAMWDRLWYDPHSRKADFSDAQHKGITTWWDLEDAIAFYVERPDKTDNFEQVLRESIEHSSESMDGTHDDIPRWVQEQGGRKRLRVVECYYREGDEWMVCHSTVAGFVVAPKMTGYLDEHGKNVCPLVMGSGFVRRNTGARYGLVRNMIGPQDEINKRTSKALHWQSVDRVVAEEGAVKDPDEAKAERSKPDGWVEVQPGALVENRIQFQDGQAKAHGELAQLQEAKAEIDTVGPEIPQLSSMPASASGRAIQMRQQIGGLELARIDDNHKVWKREIARQAWFRFRQFVPEEKWFRVRDDSEKNGFRFVGINRRITRGQRLIELSRKKVPLGVAVDSVLGGNDGRLLLERVQQQHEQMMQQAPPEVQQQPPEAHEQMALRLVMQQPEMREQMTVGDVAQLSVDILLDETPDSTIMQQEEYEQLAQQMPSFLQARPDLAGFYLEMLLEASQLRSKRKLLEMMRKPADPQQAQQQQQMAQLQQQMAQIQAALAQANVAKTQAQAEQATATAEQLRAETQLLPDQVGAEIQKDQADAMSNAAWAGAQVVPPVVRADSGNGK